MHRHILKIGPVHFEARVVERLDAITITLSVSPHISGYDPQTRDILDQWLFVIIRRPPGETRCIHVLDHQHIMTT